MRSTRLILTLLLLVPLLAGCAQPEAPAPTATEDEGSLPPPLATAAAGPAQPTQPVPDAASAAAPPQPAAADPLAHGPLKATRHEYDFGFHPHLNPQRPSAYLIPLRGSLHLPEGDGPFPVLLFQHGRHATCSVAGAEFLGGVGQCPRAPPLLAPVESHTGYDYLAANLASHGYAVASVDANAVNDLDNPWSVTNRDSGAHARADVVLTTLDRLRELNGSPDDATWGPVLAGRLDLGRVGLMGHSRGGEGVTHALLVNQDRPEAERHALRAVFAIAPIDATRATAPGVPFATLLPYCDGDVRSLRGAQVFDASRRLPNDPAPKVQLLVMGANHNFYNTVWTGDDASWPEDDDACGPDAASRLSADDQRKQGLAHVAAFFRLHLGGETAYAPLFDGTATLPASACPGGAPCPGLVHASYAPPAADALPLGAGSGTGFAHASACAPPDCGGDAPVLGSAPREVLAWKGSATYALPFPAGTDARAWEALVVRMAVEPGAAENAGLAAQDVRVVLVDAASRSASTLASAHSRALFTPPGGEDVRKVILNDVRIPLDAFAGIDLSQAREARLVFDATPQGRVHLADAMLVR